MRKRISVIACLLFFAFMLLCTLFARPMHDYYLPKVMVQKVTKENFKFKDYLEDGTEIITNRLLLAVPLNIIENEMVYVIREREHYNEMETYVALIPIKLGVKQGTYTEVLDGINSSDKILIFSDRPVNDGQAVIVNKNIYGIGN
jgi:hypothetical protein